MLMVVTTKIALQQNCKLGGELKALEIPMKGLMIMDTDSYHDFARKGRSVDIFITSLNQQCTRYYTGASSSTQARNCPDICSYICYIFLYHMHADFSTTIYGDIKIVLCNYLSSAYNTDYSTQYISTTPHHEVIILNLLTR